MFPGKKNKTEKDYLSLPGMLWRYRDADLILAYKARFIFYFCLASFSTSAVIAIYSIIIQMNSSAGKSFQIYIIAALILCALLICIILLILIKGYFSLASNMLIITALSTVWFVISIDMSDVVIKLDSIVFIFAIISMIPLIVNQRPALIVAYTLLNIPVLVIILYCQRGNLALSHAAFSDYIADVTTALVFTSVILWNVFYINRTALERLKNDIIKREEAGKAIEQSREEITSLLRFQNEMLDTAAVWIDTLDLHGNILSWNKAAERISGYSKEDVIGNGKIWEWLYPDEEYRNKIYAQSAAIINAGESVENFETIIKNKDGAERVILWNSNNLVNQKGEPVGSIALGYDTTDRRREQDEKEILEDQLRQMQKMDSIGRLAGGIAHDFNNLLTAILGTTELALRHLNRDDKLYHNFSIIKKAGESAADLTSKLLLFSRKQIIVPRVIDLNEIMEHMRGMLERMIGENIEFRILPFSNLCRIKADTSQIEQIIINLIVNARDAMTAGGVLTLETGNIFFDEEYCRYHAQILPGEYAMLAVSDTGNGISMDVQEHIYEPFFTTKDSGKGTGLGLATVYGAVKQSGGSIELYSETGFGTTFKIYFPCVKEEISAVLKTGSSSDLPTGDETILVIEDNPYVLDFIKNVITQLNYKVITAANGEDALKISAEYKKKIHLMLTDVILTGINGRILAERILEFRPDIKILYISGYTGDIISRSGILEEGIRFISKPFTGSELSRKIREILDES